MAKCRPDEGVHGNQTWRLRVSKWGQEMWRFSQRKLDIEAFRKAQQ